MANIHSLFAQLQARYPMSSLVTELVQHHENSFVVRASIQIGGTTIATGMAANPVLEIAEDQARLRSLNVVGIGMSLPSPIIEPINGSNHSTPASHPLPNSAWLDSVSSPPLESEPTLAFSNPVTSVDTNFSSTSVPDVSAPESSSIDLTPEPSSTFSSNFEPIQNPSFNEYFSEETYTPEEFDPPDISYSALEELEPVEEVKPKSSNSAKPQKGTKPEKAISPPVEEPDDLSNLIALTDIEMDRVGWTKIRGRDYLKSTYGKSTRQRLDVEELMDFLNYLRALPSASGL